MRFETWVEPYICNAVDPAAHNSWASGISLCGNSLFYMNLASRTKVVFASAMALCILLELACARALNLFPHFTLRDSILMSVLMGFTFIVFSLLLEKNPAYAKGSLSKSDRFAVARQSIIGSLFITAVLVVTNLV
jgi:hypothetical protein